LERVVSEIDKEKKTDLWSGIVDKYESARAYNLDKRYGYYV